MVVSNKKKAIIVLVLALVVLVATASAAWLLMSKNEKPGGPDQLAVQKQLNDAISLSMSGKCSEAISVFESVLIVSSPFKEIDAETKLRLGQCLMQAQKYQEAATRFSQAKDLYGELGDTPKKTQSQNLYQQAAAEASNNSSSTQPVKSSEPTPSAPPAW